MKTVWNETRGLLIWYLPLMAASVIICGLFAGFTLRLVLGVVLGSLVSALNFFLLGVSLVNAVNRTARGAQFFTVLWYLLRMVIAGCAVVLAITYPNLISVLGVSVPFIYPFIIITLKAIFEQKGGGKAE